MIGSVFSLCAQSRVVNQRFAPFRFGSSFREPKAYVNQRRDLFAARCAEFGQQRNQRAGQFARASGVPRSYPPLASSPIAAIAKPRKRATSSAQPAADAWHRG
jgi:hypothetical protein